MRQNNHSPAARSALASAIRQTSAVYSTSMARIHPGLEPEMRVEFANEFFCEAVGMPWTKVDGQLLGDLLGSPKVSEFLSDVLSGSAAQDCQTSCDIQGIGKRVLLLSANLLFIPICRLFSWESRMFPTAS